MNRIGNGAQYPPEFPDRLSGKILVLLGILTLACQLSIPTARAHEHLAAGARASEPGAELFFVNAANFAEESGYVFPLELATNGAYAGFHHVEFSFVCQPATLDYGGPAPFHPVLGARIEAQFETVEGPPGGEFEFWEAGADEEPATGITWRLPVNDAVSALRVPVSQSHGEPDADPFGHVHGRVFSATRPGLYRVGLRFVDASAHGPDGGPLHPPSGRFHLMLQAGLSIASLTFTVEDQSVIIRYATAQDFRYTLESSPHLGAAAEWTPAGDSEAGDNHLHTLSLPASAGERYFRLRREPL